MMSIYGVDFGTGKALAIFGSTGPVEKKQLSLPRVKGGRTPAMEFPMTIEALFIGNSTIPPGDAVVESPTIGSSGCEASHIQELLARHPGRSLFTVSARAVKNYRRDHDLGWKKGARYVKDGDPAPAQMTIEAQDAVHVEEAQILWRIATETPDRLYRWTGPSYELQRIHTSVRPMDKHLYRSEEAERYMALLPPFDSLPQELKDVLGNKTMPGASTDYSRSMVMPFAMATEEPHIDAGPPEDRRGRYEKVIGLYDRGYPSFYRRATIDWLEIVSKQMTGAAKKDEITFDQRKDAWRVVQRQIRHFFHLTMAHQGR